MIYPKIIAIIDQETGEVISHYIVQRDRTNLSRFYSLWGANTGITFKKAKEFLHRESNISFFMEEDETR